jgi:hypothetical protein
MVFNQISILINNPVSGTPSIRRRIIFTKAMKYGFFAGIGVNRGRLKAD